MYVSLYDNIHIYTTHIHTTEYTPPDRDCCIHIVAIAILKIVRKYGKFSEYGSLPSSGGAFYDLGSGTGKSLVTASLVNSFSSCHGIELLEGLHRGAEWVLESYAAQV